MLTGCTATQVPANSNKTGDTNDNTNVVTEINTNTNKSVEVVDNTNEVAVDLETKEEIDTSDWLTYTNEEYGFSFRYPGEWEIIDKEQWQCIELISPELKTYNAEWSKKYSNVASVDTDAVKTYDVNICYKENIEKLALKNWIEKNIDSTWVIASTTKNLNDQPGIELTTDVLGLWKELYLASTEGIIRISRLEKPIVTHALLIEEIVSTIQLIK
ncbi:MAG: hypothetical protein HYV33_02260 [Candidatus Kerfeldbacteria bacterium]|nr:hypothetical protein [Candidatus Kerfeldbacteria bacterium]